MRATIVMLSPPVLRVRHVDHGDRIQLETAGADVADDADDLARAADALVDVDADLPADRILTRPEPSGRGLTDDGDARGCLAVALLEDTAGAQRDSKCLQVARRRRTHLGVALVVAFRPAVDRKGPAEAGARDRRDTHRAGGDDPRLMANAIDVVAVELDVRRHGRVRTLGQRDADGEDVAGLEPRVDVQQAIEAADREPRPCEQNERQRNLRGDQHGANAASAAGGAAIPAHVLEEDREIGA